MGLKYLKKCVFSGVFLGLFLNVIDSSAASSLNTASVFAQDNLGKTQNTQNNVSQHPESNAVLNSKTPVKNTFTALTPAPPVLEAAGYCLEEVYSGKELGAQNADQKMPPASLTKLMTLYLSFEALQAGRIHLTDAVPVSEKAWKTGGSRMFIKMGESVSVSGLIRGIIVDSGNDACVAMAEYIGGTEENFVNLMNQQAKLLGMKNTQYRDCTGMPDPEHYTTPHDLALLTRAIILNFPQYYPWFAEKTFTYNKITQLNRNRLLWHDASVDGLKTGHTQAAGFCLIASAHRSQMRLMSILLGAPTDKTRAQYSEALLNYGFHFYETHKIYAANQAVKKIPVYYGKKDFVSAGIANDLYLTLPAGQYDQLKFDFNISSPLKAPLIKNQQIGIITISLKNKILAQADLTALEEIKKTHIFGWLRDRIKLMFKRAG